MILSQRNQNRNGEWQCMGGRGCCTCDNSKESRRKRRHVRRVEKQRWMRELAMEELWY